MTTLTKYQPALTYVPSYDTKALPEMQRLYITVKKITKSQYIRTCKGTTPEEILYTLIVYKNTAANMGQKTSDDDALTGFLTVLGPISRATYSDLVVDMNVAAGTDEMDPFEADFTKAVTAFIARIVEDPQAKDSTLAAFGDGRSFVKPPEVTVKDHHERIMALCNYVDLLPGIRVDKLNRNEKRNIFFNTFPSSWKESFKRSAHDVTTSTVQTIKEWMSMQKRDVDKDQKRKREHKDKSHREKPGKTSKKRTQTSNTVCSIHGGHKWRECKLNPRGSNFDQSALDRHRANGGGRGFQGRGRGGRGFQGRGFQGRGPSGRGFQARGPPPRENYQNYQQHDQYHQHHGPPAVINTDQQSYAASSYPTQAPPSGHWYGNQYYHH